MSYTKNRLISISKIFVCALLCALSFSTNAQFSAGNIVAYRVGDGSGALTNAAAPVFIDQYTNVGAFVNTFAVPTTGVDRLVASGSATSEGKLSVSTDGSSIVFAGYDAAVGLANVATSSGATANRIVGRMNLAYVYSQPFSSVTLHGSNNIRSACSDGTNVWCDGNGVAATGGTTYFGPGPAVQVSNTTLNQRAVKIFNGQLYYATAAGTSRGVYSVGTGTPTTTGQVGTIFINAGGTAQSTDLALNPCGTICYIADDRSLIGGGGVQRWDLIAGVWTYAGYTLATSTSSGSTSVCVDWSGAFPIVYATGLNATTMDIVKITDTGAGSPFTVLVSSAANTMFRGITFAPSSCTPVAWYQDSDGDGFGNNSVSLMACTAPCGYVADNTDCDDTDGNVNPGETEICANGIDDDCDLSIDEDDPICQNGGTVTMACGCNCLPGYTGFFCEIAADSDFDGIPDNVDNCPFAPNFDQDDFDADSLGDACDPDIDNDGDLNATDCDDFNAGIYTGASEILCNGIDENCNGNADDGVYGCTNAGACNYDPAATCDDGSCLTDYGCTNPLACNFDPLATCNDGSCLADYGCTNAVACNYDPAATCDDGSCLTDYGCTNPLACNFDPTATCSDGSCLADYGCTNAAACNYDPAATCDDGSCLTDYGCMNPLACNFDPLATCNDGSCLADYGCTNAVACNFDPTATCDDGSCLTDYGCTNPLACNFDPLATCDDGSCLADYGCTNAAACNFDPTATCDDGSCLTDYGCTNPLACNFDPTATCSDGSCLADYGCTNAAACNFDPTATCDDGSCLTDYGCTNPLACNFDPTATCSDGSCLADYGCTNAAACNFDPTATCDDGSCLTDYGCTDPIACNFDPLATCEDGSCFYNCGGPGEDPTNAVPIAVTNLGTCTATNGDLAGHTASGGALTLATTGEDFWYSFVATKPGVRIEIGNTPLNDIIIELQDAFGNLVDSENAQATQGFENLNYGGLIVGDTYIIGVRNSNSGGGIGAYTICVQAIADSECNYGPGPYTLCQTFKAVWIGGGVNYIFHFESQTDNSMYMKNNGASTFCVLSTVPGLKYGDTYDVVIGAQYTLSTAAGMEQVEVLSDNPCFIIVNAHPLMILRPSDNCANHAPHLLGNTIAGQPFVCAATDYEWKFTRTDIAELSIYHLRGAANRYIQLSAIPGLTPGGTYDVEVRPVFSYGPGNWGAVSCLQLAGPAMMQFDESNQLDATAQKQSADQEMEFGFYPNPSNGEMLYVNLVADGNVAIDIYDAMGKLVCSKLFVAEKSLNTILVFEKELSNGVYTMLVSTTDFVITEKLIIEK